MYSWGGYLGLRVPEDPVFIDGAGTSTAMLQSGSSPTQSSSAPIHRPFSTNTIDYVVFGVDQLLTWWLDASPEWRRVYADDLAGVWVGAR